MEQTNIFNFLSPTFKIDKHVRLIELFAGIGSQAKALKNLGVDFETWKVIEIDKYAMRSYNAVHGTDFEISDIKDIHASDLDIRDRESECYIMTYSFPCQDLSMAGKQKGMAKGSGTRSGLLWEVERILDECEGNLPQVLLMENVPQVISKKNISDFQMWRAKLETLGYSNFVELLNAKDYGIPQNRDRCFMVSLLGEWDYTFPERQPLQLRLKDMLEDKVEGKYYLSQKTINSFVAYNQRQEEKGNGFRFSPVERERERAVTVKPMNGGLRSDDNYIIEHFPQQCGQAGEMSDRECANAITSVTTGSMVLTTRIRRLTPRECWRLMGFTDEDFDRARQVNSETQLYKQAGNSIVVNVLMEIFRQLMEGDNA